MSSSGRSNSLPFQHQEELQWLPEDPACTTNVPDISPPQLRPSRPSAGFLDVHNLYWQPPSEQDQQHIDGLPKGFLSFLEPELDGSPKGFLSLIDDGSFLPDGKPKGFLEFVAGEEPPHFSVDSHHSKRRLSQVSWLWSLFSVGRRGRASEFNDSEGKRRSKPRRKIPQSPRLPLLRPLDVQRMNRKHQSQPSTPRTFSLGGSGIDFGLLASAAEHPRRKKGRAASLEDDLDHLSETLESNFGKEHFTGYSPRDTSPAGKSENLEYSSGEDTYVFGGREASKVGYDTSIKSDSEEGSPLLGYDTTFGASSATTQPPPRPGYADGVPGRDWNERFQNLLADVYESRTGSTAELRNLCEEFASVARRIGTIIISELFLDDSERTIPSVSRGLGGIAGGEKYVYLPEGMFFKFAVDDHNLYNGDEGIMKAAGQELRSLLELMDCRVSRLHFPLMVLVDYRGYRLIAMPLLPVGHDTIVYGSSDGGHTIHTSLPEVNARMQLVARRLNLAGHTVTSASRAREKATIYGPVDLEVHLGKDGRFYVLDIARLFPAATPVAGLKGCQLYRLLRPELVRGNPKPLCSDVFSTWDIEGLEAFNRDAEEATHRMRTVVVPDFALWLEDEYADVDFDVMEPERMIEEFVRVTSSMHRHGINLRLLGAVRQCTTVEGIRRFLFTQAVARTAKQILWGRMRNLQSESEVDYRMLVLDYSNLLFGRSERSTQYWTSGMKNSLLKRFVSALTSEERRSTCDMRSLLYLLPLFHYFQRISGFALDNGDVTDFVLETSEYYHSSWESLPPPAAAEPITPNMLLGLVSKVKTIHHIDFAEGTLLSQQATAATEGAEALFELADERFKATLERKPDDFRALHNWGLSLFHRAKRAGTYNEAEELYRLAEQKFEASLVINPRDSFALYLWANMLSSQAMRQRKHQAAVELFERACEKYAASDALQPDKFDVVFNWANALLYQAGFVEGELLLRQACELYDRAVASGDPKTAKALRNWGVALSRLARLASDHLEAAELFDRAEDSLRQSLDRAASTSNSEVYFNWGNLHYHRAKALMNQQEDLSAAQQLILAGEKYVAALENGGGFTASLLINWGKSLCLLAHLEQIPPGLRLLDVVDMYLGIVVALLFTEMGRPSLKPVVALGCCGRLEIVRRVVGTLRRIATTATGKALFEARQGLEVIDVLQEQAGNSVATILPPGVEQPPISPSVAVFLTNMKLPRSSGETGSVDGHIPSLRDFEKLSNFTVYGNCCECSVALRTTATLYTMKMVKRKCSPPGDDSAKSSSFAFTSTQSLMPGTDAGISEADSLVTAATAGGIPFLVQDVYIYRRRKALYFIQELTPSELLLCRIRQSAEALASRLSTGNPWARRSQDRRQSDPDSHRGPLPLRLYNNSLRRSASDFLPMSGGRAPPPGTVYARCLLPEDSCRFYAAEIVAAFTTLHRLGFVYGNLLPMNLHIDGEGHVCLTRFSYHAASEGAFSQLTDWWSLGSVLYDLFNGTPYTAGEPLTFPAYVSGAARDFVTALLEEEEDKRLGRTGPDEVLSHPFFAGIDWKVVVSRGLEPPFLPSCLGLMLPQTRPRSEPPRTSGFGFERAATIMAANLDAAFEWFSVNTLAPAVETPAADSSSLEPHATLGSLTQLAEHLEEQREPAN